MAALIEEQPRDLPPVEVESSTPGDTLSVGALREHVARNTSALLPCFEQLQADRGGHGGLLVVRFEISPSGEVASSSVVDSELGHPGAESCVAEAVGRMRFQLPEDAPRHVVTYTFLAIPWRAAPPAYDPARPPYLMDPPLFAF